MTELSASLDVAIATSQSLNANRAPPNGRALESMVLSYATGIYAFRRKRAKWLPEDLFGEPAWDILLELFVMRLQGNPVRVKNVCIASGVPATTALGWINVLEGKGMISSSADACDHRVRWIWLEDVAFEMLFKMLADQIEHDEKQVQSTLEAARTRPSVERQFR